MVSMKQSEFIEIIDMAIQQAKERFFNYPQGKAEELVRFKVKKLKRKEGSK